VKLKSKQKQKLMFCIILSVIIGPTSVRGLVTDIIMRLFDQQWTNR